MVEAKFAIDGMVDKPDIIGAVFGQTEGLLGDELDLRELQKSGKIGRIEIELAHGGNKCNGKLYLPASLDRIETCILAASIEAVDRVGPYEATFQVERVEDTRSEKRRKILSRAKELVKQLMDTGMPDSKELSEIVQSDVRISEITSYGPEHLPAGPEVGKSPELIIVEGRADVLTLLKSDITNGIAIGGASAAPKTIINLCREKEVTVFLDGDRGGDLILRNLVNVAEVDFVARAPDGKEVEDLTRKEIIKALRTKVPLDQYMGRARQPYREKKEHPQYEQQEQSTPQPRAEEEKLEQEEAERHVSHASSQDKRDDFGINDLDDAGQIEKIDSSRYAEPTEAVQQKPALESAVFAELGNGLGQLTGTLRSRLYDHTGSVLKEMPIRDLLATVQNSSGVYAIVLDGVITQRLVELALQKGIKAIYGLRANPMQRKHTGIVLYTKEQGSVS